MSKKGNKKRSYIAFGVLAVIMLNIILVSAITGSMGNARMVLYPEVNGKTFTTIEKTILVKNVNNVTINISLKTDNNSESFLDIVDKEFVLQPNSEKKAGFVIKVKDEGRYEGKINVFFTSTEGKEAGVVLTSTIVVIAGGEGSTNGDDNGENTSRLITGKAITGNSNISSIVILSLVSTFILLIVLVFLIYLINSKKKKLKENKKIKRGKKEDEK